MSPGANTSTSSRRSWKAMPISSKAANRRGSTGTRSKTNDGAYRNMDLNYLVGSAALAAALIAHPGTAADNVVTPATTVQADASAANRAPAAAIETEYVRPLMRIEAGRNDSNPTWSPSGALLAIERSRGDKKEIVIAHPDGSVAEIIYYQLSGESKEKKFFFPGILDDTSYT